MYVPKSFQLLVLQSMSEVYNNLGLPREGVDRLDQSRARRWGGARERLVGPACLLPHLNLFRAPCMANGTR